MMEATPARKNYFRHRRMHKTKLSKTKLSKCQCCYPLTRVGLVPARAAALAQLHQKSISGASAESSSASSRQTYGRPSFPMHRLPPP